MSMFRLYLTNQTSYLHRVHPFFLNDFSTKVVVPGTQSTGQEMTNRSLGTISCVLPGELTEESHHASQPTFTMNNAQETRQIKPHPTIHAQLSTSPSKRGKKVNPLSFQFQKKSQFTKSHQPIQLMKDTSSSSSTQPSSGRGVNEEKMLLPVYSFMEYKNAPAVVYTKSESEANSLVETLKGPLGLDLEWRVMWHPGAQERRTALVQLCDHHTILLIQEVIESADIVKTGANILNDGEKLLRDFGIRAKGLVELGAFATKADVKFSSVYNREIVSLAKMVAMYLGRTLLKGKVRTSNWEADLTHKMIECEGGLVTPFTMSLTYVTLPPFGTQTPQTTCHCALMVYDKLQEIAAQAGETLDMSTYSCQVNPRSLKLKDASVPTLPQSIDAFTKPHVPNYCIPEPPRPQQLRAYKLWQVDKMPLDEMCMKLRIGARVEPLKESTVISYVIGALQADPRLPFDMDELKALVVMEAGSWQRHRQWIASRE
ncbi:ribonuclease H-like protein [Lanmaoa asiatica]|nr:ribonuclease H-like protein [Lanmaoa asiatica]